MLAWATQLARRGECEKRQREARAIQQLVQAGDLPDSGFLTRETGS